MTFIVGAIKKDPMRPANIALTQHLDSDAKLASSEAPDRAKQDIYSVETEPTIH